MSNGRRPSPATLSRTPLQMCAHEPTKMEAPVKVSVSPSNTVVIFTKASSSEKRSVEADQEASTSTRWHCQAS